MGITILGERDGGQEGRERGKEGKGGKEEGERKNLIVYGHLPPPSCSL